MNRERAIYFAGLMEEYLNIPSCVCENIENELINEKYNKVINYVIDRRKELENKTNYKTSQEIIDMYLEYKERIDKAIKYMNKEENKQLKDNWNKLKEYAQELFDNPSWASCGARYVLEKMQELESGDSNE